MGLAAETGAETASATKAPIQKALDLVTVFTSGQEGCHTFRIPATAVTSRGTVLAFAEGRKNSASDTGDIDLGLKRSTDGGRRCGAPDIVWDDSLNTCGHPCPVVERRRVRFPYALPNARRANELKGCV